MSLESTLVKVVNRLTDDGIIFALAGGFAYSIHIIPRATVGIDFVIFTENDTLRIKQSLEKIFDSLILHKNPIKAGNFDIWRFIGINDEERL